MIKEDATKFNFQVGGKRTTVNLNTQLVLYYAKKLDKSREGAELSLDDKTIVRQKLQKTIERTYKDSRKTGLRGLLESAMMSAIVDKRYVSQGRLI